MSEKTIPVKVFDDLIEHLQMGSNDVEVYFNRQTFEFFMLVNEYGIDGWDEEEQWEDDEEDEDGNGKVGEQLSESELEERRLRIEVQNSADWLSLPSSYEVDERSMMIDFARAQKDEKLRETLLDHLHRKGAFRRFKEEVFQRGIRDEWFEFRDEAFGEVIEGWLDEHGLSVEGRPKRFADEEE